MKITILDVDANGAQTLSEKEVPEDFFPPAPLPEEDPAAE